MRKLFLFATVAAAGLFASCSSTDDAISDAGNSGVENVDGDKTAIKIGIGNVTNTDETRGTGTIGGVGVLQGHASNVWYGQSINVFMFNKIPDVDPTLTLAVETPGTTPVYYYNNREMITPGSTENLIDAPTLQTPTASGEAMNADGSVKYYPTYGNFDFFGYHGDDALTGDVTMGTENDATWTVPFTIDGSQDLMSTKAELTHFDDDPSTTDEDESHNGQDYIMSQAPTARQKDYYSAYSARKGVQPTLTFSHLLSRLQFHIKAGSASAAGYGKAFKIDNYSPVAELTNEEYAAIDAVDGFNAATYWSDVADSHTTTGTTMSVADYNALNYANKANDFTANRVDGLDEARAVRVKSISVESKAKGTLAVAWTGDKADYQKIVWDASNNAPIEMFLKERPHAVKTEANSTLGTDDYVDGIAPVALTALDEQKTALTARKGELDALTDPTEAEIAELNVVTNQLAAVTKDINNFWKAISQETFNSLVTTAGLGQNKFTLLTDNQKNNAQLVTLTPKAVEGTSPNYSTDAITSDPEQIGEALIIAPNATTDGTTYEGETLKMHVTVAQMVPTDWRYPYQLNEKEQTYELTIPLPKVNSANDAFRINHSYNVNLTIYSLERIQVLTTVSEWENGGNRQVGGDDDTDWTEHPDMDNDPE